MAWYAVGGWFFSEPLQSSDDVDTPYCNYNLLRQQGTVFFFI